MLTWASIVQDKEKPRTYKRTRGKGGFIRANWDETAEMVAAAHTYIIKR